MQPSSNPGDPSSAFEAQLAGVENGLESAFSPDSDPARNIEVLEDLLSKSKPELETYLSGGSLISLDDKDYERLRRKMGDLVVRNRTALGQV